MAKRTTSPPQAPQLSPSQMRTAITKIQRRIKELQEFEPTSIQSKSDPRIRVLEIAIDGTLTETFGHQTPEYNRYAGATDLDRGLSTSYMGRRWLKLLRVSFKGKSVRLQS
jgi:hypothetical protein